MPISERTLRRWRREALSRYTVGEGNHQGRNIIDVQEEYITQLTERILRMTQELMDQHLLRIKR